MATADIKRAAVLGFPVKHSLSPLVHGYWLKHYNIKGSYEAISVKPQDLERKLRELVKKGFIGFNLTLPHKESAFKLVDGKSAIAKRIGAINTIEVKK